MWSSYTLHLFTWFACAQVDEKWGHGPRREQMALTRLAPWTKKISCRAWDWWIPRSNFKLLDAKAATTHDGHVRRVGSWISSTLCFQLWTLQWTLWAKLCWWESLLVQQHSFQGSISSVEERITWLGSPTRSTCTCSTIWGNHWIQWNTIEYRKCHLTMNGILNPIESFEFIWCNCNICNAQDAALRCDALADFCLGLFLSLECHGCTKSSEEACIAICHVSTRFTRLCPGCCTGHIGGLVELRFCLLTLYLVTHTFVTEAKLGCNLVLRSLSLCFDGLETQLDGGLWHPLWRHCWCPYFSYLIFLAKVRKTLVSQ